MHASGGSGVDILFEKSELYRRGSDGRRGEPLLFIIASHYPLFGYAGHKLISKVITFTPNLLSHGRSIVDLRASERRMDDNS